MEEYDPKNPNDFLKILSKQNLTNKKIEKNKLTGEEKAWKMLEKMGWKGKGLGKYEQGITVPLITRKTSKNQGIILNYNTNFDYE